MKLFSSWPILLALAATLSGVHAQTASTDPVPETKEQHDARMAWWRAAKFGMFIHWDMSSVSGKEISWSRGGSKPLDISGDPAGYKEDPVYDNLYKKFDPEKFDATKWVQIAQDAGMKYIVFTAKHHGGFAMFDTKLTDYSIMHTAFHRDVVGELAAACHKAGMRFGIYYSPRDWHQPDYGIGDNRKYNDYMNGQIRELLTNYGKVDVIWFDSYGKGDLITFWRENETWDLIKKLQPNILVNNRLAILGNYDQQPKPYLGDFETPEQNLGSFDNRHAWESCITLSGSGNWSYHPNDSVRSFKEVVQDLVSCACGDGNMLLDVGPTPEGEIPAAEVSRLAEVGAWMRKCGKSIYDTRAGPFDSRGVWGGSTHKDNTVYLHITHWAAESLHFPLLKHKVVKVTNLSSPEAVPQISYDADFMTVTLPAAKQDPVDTVLQLDLDGPAADDMVTSGPGSFYVSGKLLAPPFIGPTVQAADGSLVLIPEAARLEGGEPQVQMSKGVVNIGYWGSTRGSLSWNTVITKPGTFTAKLTYSSIAPGSQFTLSAGGPALAGSLTNLTKDWEDPATMTVGDLQIPAAGPVTIKLQATKASVQGVMGVYKIVLTPK